MTLIPSLRKALLSTALVSVAGLAQAAGTAPGVPVNNSIDISYSTGGNTISETDAASVDFVVDRKVDFLFEGQDAGGTVTVEQGSPTEQLTFRLVNEGNDASGYDINVSGSGTLGLTYDASGGGAPGTYSVYIDTAPGALSGSEVLYDTSGTVSIGDIAADGETYVKIVANIPASAADGQSDTFDVTSTALDAGTSTVTTETASPTIGNVDTILADPGEDGTEDATENYLVTAPVLSASKTSAVASENLDGAFDCGNDPADTSADAFVPGGCVAYTITVTNAPGASSAATNLTLTDSLPDDVTFVSIFSNTGFDSVVENSGEITASAASLAAGATAEAVIRVTID